MTGLSRFDHNSFAVNVSPSRSTFTALFAVADPPNTITSPATSGVEALYRVENGVCHRSFPPSRLSAETVPAVSTTTAFVPPTVSRAGEAYVVPSDPHRHLSLPVAWS